MSSTEKRYTITFFDTISNPNPIYELQNTRLKRYVLYDNLKNEIVSQPVLKGSDEHKDMVNRTSIQNDQHRNDFNDYNIAIHKYINDNNNWDEWYKV